MRDPRTSEVTELKPVQSLLVLLVLLTTSCTSSTGLSIRSPKHGKSVAQNEIVLQWEPTMEAADEVRYQLYIQNKDEIQVYSAVDIREPWHLVTTPLPEGKYDWGVRPIYLRDGQWMPGPWSQREWMYFFVVFITWGHSPYEFEVVQPAMTR